MEIWSTTRAVLARKDKRRRESPYLSSLWDPRLCPRLGDDIPEIAVHLSPIYVTDRWPWEGPTPFPPFPTLAPSLTWK
jgi:hypothetical protein